MLRALSHSLALRVAAVIAAAAACGVLIMIGLAEHLAQQRLISEREAIHTLAIERANERLAGEVTLANSQIDMLAAGFQDALALIAGEPEMQAAIGSRDTTALQRELSEGLARSGFVDGIVIDQRANVLATMRKRADLDRLTLDLNSSGLGEQAHDLLDAAHLGVSEGYRRLVAMDREIAALFESGDAQAVFLVAVPVRGADRALQGLLIAVRPLKTSEPMLTNFAGAAKLGVSILLHGKVISRAGAAKPWALGDLPADGRFLWQAEADRIARCTNGLTPFVICIERAIEEVSGFEAKVAAIGAEQAQHATRLLMLAGLGAMLLLALISFLIAWRATRPLIALAHRVEAISRGRFEIDVPHAARHDEIGQIARAVAQMRGRLQERDRMRAEMVRIDAINQRRAQLAGALARFESGIGAVLSDLGEALQRVDRSRLALDTVAEEANRRMERVRASAVATAASTQAMNGATLSLSEQIGEIGRRTRDTRNAVGAGVSHLDHADRALAEAAGCARDAGDDLVRLHELVSGFSLRLLRLVQHEPSPGNAGSSALSFTDFAAESRDLSVHVLDGLGRMQALMQASSAGLGASRDTLGTADQHVGEIALVAAEQGAAAREIATCLANAATAMAALNEAADQFGDSLAGAHDATGEIIAIARRMLEDARQIDQGVRSFIADAAA